MNPHWALASSLQTTYYLAGGVGKARQGLSPNHITDPPYLVTAYLKTVQTPANKCMLMDTFFSLNTIEHPSSPTPTINVMYRDAHVVSVTIPPIVYSYFQMCAPQFTWGFPTYQGSPPAPTNIDANTWAVAPQNTLNGGNLNGGGAMLSPLQTSEVGTLGYAVGLSNYIDLFETLGQQGNPKVQPNGSPTSAADPYYMITGLRMGNGTPPLPSN